MASSKPARRGRFITFEGGEGAGKSTQIKLLAASLREAGLTVDETREPGGSPRAELIRKFILSGEAKPMGVATEVFLFNAARYDHVVNRIAPALSAGTWVLCDRFADSSRVYQSVAGGVDMALARGLETLVVGETRPDLTFILDLPAEIGLARASARRGASDTADRFEAESLAMHECIRAGYLAIAEEEPARCAVIDANGEPAEVASAIRRIVAERLKV
ncbi:dTMP kinase [Terrarubrum flagellatum]|uniref:dTMP kinase n=1 Tax=Terrirubrum flagellatum TaxID=2895980 RepID=UPI0031451E84